MAATAVADVPVPLTPAAEARTAYPLPHFTWSGHPAEFKDTASPVSYEIQIASDDSFSSLVDEDAVWLPRYVHDRPLLAGTYHWRVRSVLYGGSSGMWSKHGVFAITPSDEELTVDFEPGPLDLAALEKADARAKQLADQGRSVKLTFPPGDYRIGESLAGPLIALEGTSGIVIDGTGVRLHFASRKQGPLTATAPRPVQSDHVTSSSKAMSSVAPNPRRLA